MSKFLKNGNFKLYFYMLCLGAMFCLWRGGETVNQKLGLLQVKAVPAVPERQVATDTKSFYPVWVKQAAALKADAAREEGNVDDLFNKKEEEKPIDPAAQVPKEPDYPSEFKSTAQLDAVADNGAVFSGRFYRLGEPLTELAIMRQNGSPITPVLVAVKANQVSVRVGAATVVIKAPSAF